MGKYEQRQSSSDIAPSQFPTTTPPTYPSSDYSFTLQTVMEMQKTLGQLTQAVTTLTDESRKRGETLDKISHKVYAAQVVITIAAVVLGGVGSALLYLLIEIWKTISPLLHLNPHP